jgi:acetoin utilization deacetylase AcuC-like enzyme
MLETGICTQDCFTNPQHPFDDATMMEDVYAMHDKDYVQRVIANSLSDKEKRRIGLYGHEYDSLIASRTFAEVGGTVLACELAIKHGLATSLAGGTHHAHHAYGSGFCVVNDIAIAAHRSVRIHKSRVLVFDLDVHQVGYNIFLKMNILFVKIQIPG